MRRILSCVGILLTTSCVDTSDPTFISEDVPKPRHYLVGGIDGPTHIGHLGNFEWSVWRTNSTCVDWFRRDAGSTDSVLVGTDYSTSAPGEYSTYFRSITNSSTVGFDLIAVGYNSNPGTCTRTTPAGHASISVTASNPLYPQLYVSMNPSDARAILSPGNYSWTASVSGGTGTYSYEWNIYWQDHNYWSGPYTGNSVDTDVVAVDGDFLVYLTVTSGNQSANRVAWACNFIYPNDYSCT